MELSSDLRSSDSTLNTQRNKAKLWIHGSCKYLVILRPGGMQIPQRYNFIQKSHDIEVNRWTFAILKRHFPFFQKHELSFHCPWRIYYTHHTIKKCTQQRLSFQQQQQQLAFVTKKIIRQRDLKTKTTVQTSLQEVIKNETTFYFNM